MNSNLLCSLRLSLLLSICFVLFFTTAAQSFQVTIDGSALTIQYFIRNVSTGQVFARNGIASLDLSPGTYRLDSGQSYEFEVDGSGSITIIDATGTLIASGASQITVDPSKVHQITVDGSALTIQYFIRDVLISRAAARNGIASFDLLPGTYRLDSGQSYEFEVDGSGSITIIDATGTLIASGASQITVNPSKVLRLNVDGSFLPGLYFIRDVSISRGARRNGIAFFDVLPGNYRIEQSGNRASFAVDSNCNLTPPSPYVLGGISVPVTCSGANSPPVANCKDIGLDLDASGQATLDPSDVDDGSSDPDPHRHR